MCVYGGLCKHASASHLQTERSGVETKVDTYPHTHPRAPMRLCCDRSTRTRTSCAAALRRCWWTRSTTPASTSTRRCVDTYGRKGAIGGGEGESPMETCVYAMGWDGGRGRDCHLRACPLSTSLTAPFSLPEQQLHRSPRCTRPRSCLLWPAWASVRPPPSGPPSGHRYVCFHVW